MENKYPNKPFRKAWQLLLLVAGIIFAGSFSSFAQSALPIQGNDAVRCGAGELTLKVEWSGATLDSRKVKWYTEPYYGTPIAEGLTYNTGYIEYTHTFFVDYIDDSGCSQCDRLMIRAVIENQVVNPQVIYSTEYFCNSTDAWHTPSIVGSSSGSFSITPSVGSGAFNITDGSFNSYNLSDGDYDITYQPDVIEGCNSNPVTVTLSVTEAPTPPAISYPLSAYCVSSGVVNIDSQTGASGGSYSATPAGLDIDAETGAITPATSTQGDYTVSYFVPASGGCAPVSATANIRIDAASDGGDAIASNSEISSGGSTTISLSNYVGDIQWQISTDNTNFSDLTGETSASYNTEPLTETTYYRAKVTNGVCSFDYSTTATVTVSAASVAGTATATPSEICDGSTTLLELTGYTGNIQWQNNETGAFVDIPGATADSYTTASLSITTPGTDRTVKYRAVVTEGLSAPDISDELSLTIRPNPQPGIVLGDEICSGSDGTVTVFDYLGDAVQWQSSTTENGTYADIEGATSDTYTETSMSSTTYYRAKITNGPCNEIYTDPVAIVVYPPSIAGTATTSQDQICTGGTADITLTGYTGSVTWEYQAPDGEWIYAGSSDAFTTNALNELGTHKYQATVKSGNCVEAISSVVNIQVVPQPSWTNYTAPSSTITYGESVSFDVDIADGLGGTIAWTRSTTPGGAGETVTSPDTPNAVGTYYYRPTYTPTGENCSLADGTEYTVGVEQKELTVSNATVTTKTYDGNTDASITGATLAGLVLGDTEDTHVSLDNDGSGTFASANAGTHSVTTSMTISGDKAGNYTLTQPSLSGKITQLQLTANNPSITTSKTYDGNTTAAVTAGSLTNIVGPDEVSINTTTATYDDKNAGTSKTITVAYTITGAQADNYLAPVDYEVTTGEISQLQLTANNPSITTSKTYDGNTTAAVTAGSLTNIVGADEVSINTTTATYDDKNVGTSKTITVAYSITGAQAGNYLTPVDYEVTTGEISQLQLTADNPSITTSKTYDGNTTAAVTAGNLTNIVVTDEVSINTTTATYDDKNVGTSKTITVAYTITGAQADNYLAPVDYEVTTGEISQLQLTASDPTITKSKVYDGNTTANVTAGSLTNVVSGNNVTISNTTANYNNADIGTGKTITVVYTIGGDDAGNYSAPNNFSVTDGVITEPIIQVLSTSGSITGAAYTTLKAAYDKINDGSHQGDITIKIYQSISDEDATATLNQSGVGSANYTSITIIAANNISVSGAASPLLILGSN